MCVESEIRGDVTIGKAPVPPNPPRPGVGVGAGDGVTPGCSSAGPRTVIHPKARIIAEAGPIVIGEGNLIEEQALIINGCAWSWTAVPKGAIPSWPPL